MQRSSLERAPSHILAGNMNFEPIAWTIGANTDRAAGHNRHRAAPVLMPPASPAPAEASGLAELQAVASEAGAMQMQTAPSLQSWTVPVQQAAPAVAVTAEGLSSDAVLQTQPAALATATASVAPAAPLLQQPAERAGMVDPTAAVTQSPPAALADPPAPTSNAAAAAVPAAAVLDPAAGEQPAAGTDAVADAAGLLSAADGPLQLSPRSPHKAVYHHTLGIVSQALFLAAHAADIAVVLVSEALCGWL